MSLKLVKVEGASMEPTYREGDWLLINFSSKPKLPKAGSVVVIEREEQPGIFYIKRISEVRASTSHQATIYVLSDNPAGTDSRTWGWLPLSSLIGKVLLRVKRN